MGILWAVLASSLMLYGALESDNFPNILSIFMDKSTIFKIIGSLIYVISNFIIFTVPAFLVYASSATLNNIPKFKWNSKSKIKSFYFFVKHCIKLVGRFSPYAIVFLVLYMVAALIRGDVSTDDSKSLIDYGYFVGVIITSLLFGFRDREITENQKQTYNTEVQILQKKVKTLKKENKLMSVRYYEMRNKGKRELAKLEKRYRIEDANK